MPRYVIQLQEVDEKTAEEFFAKVRAREEAEKVAASAAPERRIIAVDASSWRGMAEFYDVVPSLLGIPERHGRSQGELAKAMVGGEAGAIEAPYTLRISSVAALPSGLAIGLHRLQERVYEARRTSEVERGREVEVNVELLPHRGVRASGDGKLTIDVDASRWTSSGDLYDAILPQLGAPDWHGDNVNALTESIVWGEINAIEPPYLLRIRGTANLPPDVAEELGWLREDVAKHRAEFRMRKGRDVDVDVELLP